MKILQLVSDWKWTGPAEPMLVLTRALRARGHEVELVCPMPPPDANRSLWEESRARGVEPLGRLERGRSALRPGDRAEVARIRSWIQGAPGDRPFDIVHCWHGRDHLLAARALSRTRPGRRGPLAPGARSVALVRSLASAEAVSAWPWNRWLLGPGCDGLLCVSRSAARAQRRLRGGRPIQACAGAVEIDDGEVHAASARPAPTRGSAPDAAGRTLRAQLGIPEAAPLIGVVARIQPHRRFDLLLAAMQRVARERPDARLLLIGRGTRADELTREPARRMGLSSHVILAGYRTADYLPLLGCLDLLCFLVPGSDGSCRALLEAATLGLPLVGSRRGAIPEIIRDGVTGVLVDEDPDRLAEAWLGLIADPERRHALGAAAARDARQRFTPARLAGCVEGFYETLAAAAGAAPTSSR